MCRANADARSRKRLLRRTPSRLMRIVTLDRKLDQNLDPKVQSRLHLFERIEPLGFTWKVCTWADLNNFLG
jgi:hypothetical protein